MEQSTLERITVQDFLENLAKTQERQSKKIITDIVNLQERWTPAFRFIHDARCRLELDAALSTMKQTAIRLELASESTRDRIASFDNQMPLMPEDEPQEDAEDFAYGVGPDLPAVDLDSMSVTITADDKPALQAGAKALRQQKNEHGIEYTPWPALPWEAGSPEKEEYNRSSYNLRPQQELQDESDLGNRVARGELARRKQVDQFIETIAVAPEDYLRELSDDGNPYAEKELARREDNRLRNEETREKEEAQ